MARARFPSLARQAPNRSSDFSGPGLERDQTREPNNPAETKEADRDVDISLEPAIQSIPLTRCLIPLSPLASSAAAAGRIKQSLCRLLGRYGFVRPRIRMLYFRFPQAALTQGAAPPHLHTPSL